MKEKNEKKIKKSNEIIVIKSKKKKILTIVIVIVFILLLFMGISIGLVYKYTSEKMEKVQQIQIPQEKLGIEKEIEEKLEEYTNIAVFGIDSSDLEYKTGNRSDCIIIASINNNTKEIKLVSIYRDTYVNIEGHGLDKITHAYSYGGPELAINTINTNFDLNISEFVTVNFDSVSDVIDQLGGIEINIQENELQYINSYINSTSNSVGKKSVQITNTGIQTLDGIQAVAYSRIRYTEGGDYKRTERMRDVIIAIIEKAKTKKISELNNIVDNILPKVATNITLDFVLKMIPRGFNYSVTKSIGWPYEIRGITLNLWYGVPVTLESNVVKLHQEIFNESEYIVSDTVKSISDKIIRKTGYKY